MIRTFVLHSTLEKKAGFKELRIDCDTQQQLFAALRNVNPSMNMALRGATLGLCATDEDDKNYDGIRDGFNFGNSQKRIHVITPTDGAWTLVIYAVIAIVASIVVTKLMAPQMPTNSNGPGGARSTMFNGPVNSTDQGGAIGQMYGKKFLVGTQIFGVDESYVNAY